jgi:hypothetical protein
MASERNFSLACAKEEFDDRAGGGDGTMNVKFGMEIVVNIPALHVWDSLLECNAVYHDPSKRR